jgi:hypothetical protein
VGLETASLLIATVRAVPWREHADEAVENLPIIQNNEQFSFRRARATHDSYHIASRLETFFQINSKIQLKVCSSIRSMKRSQYGAELSGHSWSIEPIGTWCLGQKTRG